MRKGLHFDPLALEMERKKAVLEWVTAKTLEVTPKKRQKSKEQEGSSVAMVSLKGIPWLPLIRSRPVIIIYGYFHCFGP